MTDNQTVNTAYNRLLSDQERAALEPLHQHLVDNCPHVGPVTASVIVWQVCRMVAGAASGARGAETGWEG